MSKVSVWLRLAMFNVALRVHDELHILPSNGGGNTKSLQVMDDDVQSAQSGDRVGIAIRGAKDDSLSNGSIIVKPAINDKKPILTSHIGG